MNVVVISLRDMPSWFQLATLGLALIGITLMLAAFICLPGKLESDNKGDAAVNLVFAGAIVFLVMTLALLIVGIIVPTILATY